jgi:hypothetical protein
VDERYRRGSWNCSYRVSPVEQPPSLPEFLRMIREVAGHETGWPVWLILDNTRERKPYVKDGVIECWLNDTELSDFWRADPQGQMSLTRLLQEDLEAPDRAGQGEIFAMTLPVWRTGECLLHAGRLAGHLGANTVELMMTWAGLQGRELSSFGSPNRWVPPGYICHENEVRTSITVEALAIPDTLPVLVKRLVAPLYANFGFFVPPDELYTAEIDRMRYRVR